MMDLLQDITVKYYLSALLALYPMWRVHVRAGFSGVWAMMLAVPFAGVVLCLGNLALRRWPVAFVEGAK